MASGEGAPRVLFVATAGELASKRYRVDNLRTHLRRHGIPAEVIFNIDVARRLREGLPFDLIVLQRVPADADVRHLVLCAREAGIRLVFEVDDYVFDAAAIPSITSLREESPERRAEFERYVAGCRETLLLCDCFLGSTYPLVEHARALGRPGYVIRNGLNDRQLALGARALARRDRQVARACRDAVVRIGYLSGTNTHRADFAVAAPALARLMSERPEVVLVIQGPLAVPDDLAAYAARIERRHFVSWQRLVASTAALDIVLAPLESDNPFTACKSALKYFEAGLVAVPVVASPTDDFARAITAGTNGLLARTTDEWYDSLHSLVASPARRRALGAAARADVLRAYTPAAQSRHTMAVFERMWRGEPAGLAAE